MSSIASPSGVPSGAGATSAPANGFVTGRKPPSKLDTIISGAAHLSLFDSRLRPREAGARDEIRRARDVAHLHAVAELHRGRLATVLAADPDLQIRSATAAPLDADLDQLADALLVQDRERIVRHQTHVQVPRQELRDVVPAVAVGELGEISVTE